ncbi:MAG: penicillin-binding transpeptidase domain-containing protein [Anaerolineae bacterium]|jgi:penicillin-binding protein 2|nr:penicillin-binding transpeptidase domain-containing protein [Anaerolineae bacterium]
MKYRLLSILLLISIVLTSCNPGAAPTGTDIPEPTAAPLPTAEVVTTSVPDVEETVNDFIQAWSEARYSDMFAMLSQLTHDATGEENFIQRYQQVAQGLGVTAVNGEILSVMTGTKTAQVAYRVAFTSSLITEYTTSEIIMDLALESGEWKIDWHDGLIMPQLRGGNTLQAEVTVPARGNIYSADGEAFAAQDTAYAIAVQPDRIESEGTMLAELSRVLDMPTADIQEKYEYARDTNWYIAIGDAPADKVTPRYDQIVAAGGVWLNEFDARYYYAGEAAAQVIGVVQPIPQEQLAYYQGLGYTGTEVVGVSGIEKGSEEELRGQRGADVYVVNPEGQIIDRLGHSDSYPSLSVTTTMEYEFQVLVEKALSDKTGAVVVLERDTGRVLAMASNPTFNPNLYDADNANRDWLWNEVFVEQESPTLNRATQSGYPLGSVFKIITMAAALESGLYQADTMYTCGYTFEELAGQVFYDWTYEKEVAASGELTLQGGLMRSCNPYFYHIGLDLYRQNFETAIADMAIGFGLGSQTGIGQLDEEDGNVPMPQSEGDAIQLAIGQGTLQVTPLQVATFMAAMGNGGTLYEPQVVEHYTAANGEIVEPFTPIKNGELPVSAENLDIILEAMLMVTANERGTAYSTFRTFEYPVYAKTGTAQTSLEDPHAWFAGFTDANIPGKPDIAIAVITEFAGDGSAISAPIFRRVAELYFFGQAYRLYPWEQRLWVTYTPTLLDYQQTGTAVQKATDAAIQEATQKAEEEQEQQQENNN